MRNSADLFQHYQASNILRLSNHLTAIHSASLITALCIRNKNLTAIKIRAYNGHRLFHNNNVNWDIFGLFGNKI